MERLTKRLEDGQAVMDCAACGVSWHKKRKKDIPYCTALFCRNRLKERLAAYEDTGLEPDAVNAIKHSLMGKSIAEMILMRHPPSTPFLWSDAGNACCMETASPRTLSDWQELKTRSAVLENGKKVLTDGLLQP